ncbi:MAG: ABC transporter permease [Bauldia sp.]|nr:ABC transporter permease [Bauldia sp.]
MTSRTWLVALAALLVLVAINWYLQPNLMTPRVVRSNLSVFLPVALVAIGQTYVILAGDIDLSVGAIVSLVNVIVVSLIASFGGDVPGILGAMAIGVGVGIACGLVNGFLVAVLRLQSIVSTFATGIVFGALALLVMPTAGGSVPSVYWRSYGGTLGGVPVIYWIYGVSLLMVAFIAARPFFKHLAAVGGHRAASFQTGLPTTRIRIGAYALCGLFSAFAALCLTGETASGDPLLGQALALSSILAVVVGGTALAGGRGSAFGSILGAIVVGTISNVVFFARPPFEYQTLIEGAITLAALAGGVLVARGRRTQ